jgi:hypothetical protein
MNLLKWLVFASISIIYSSNLFAQSETSKEVGKWHIKNILYLNETQGIAIADYKPEKNSVVSINNQASVLWESPIEEHIYGISKFKGNVLAFYKKAAEIHMSTLDAQSGKIISDKVIYDGDKHKIVTVQNDLDGNFENVLARAISNPYNAEGTKGLKLITLAADGNPVVKDVPSIALEGSFVNSCITKEGHIILATIANDALVIEQFTKEAALKTKLDKPLNCRKKLKYKGIMQADNFAGNSIVVSLKYENIDKDDVFSYYTCNLDTKKIVSSEEAPLNKESAYKFKNRESLTPEQIYFTNDKTVFVKEVNYVHQSAGPHVIFRNISEFAVVSIYDKKLKLLKEVVLEKAHEMFSNSPVGIAGRITIDKLQLISGDYNYNRPDGDYCYTIDLNTGNLVKKKLGAAKDHSSQPVCSHSTFWFKNECIVSRLSGSYGSYTNRLEKVDYATLN